MKQIFLCLILFSCISSSSFGQTIVCDSIDFKLMSISESDTAYAGAKFRLKVYMALSVFDLKKDTITLKTNIKLAQKLGPENLKVYLLKKDGYVLPLGSFVNNTSGAQLFQDTQFLNIILPKREDANLIVSYDVIGTGLFFYLLHQNYPNVVAFHCQQEYFYPMNIPIRAVHAASPDNMQSFCSNKNG